MKRVGVMVVACVVSVGVMSAAAGPEHAIESVQGSAELERVKALAGRWEGAATHMGGSEEEPAAIEYKVTSGGSAVVETLFPGTPHEMVSVYHDGPGGKISMTHYCMLRNQPQLDLVGSDGQRLEFSLSAQSAVPASEPHMHALTLTLTDSDHLTQAWTSYQNGQAEAPTTIRVSRVR